MPCLSPLYPEAVSCPHPDKYSFLVPSPSFCTSIFSYSLPSVPQGQINLLCLDLAWGVLSQHYSLQSGNVQSYSNPLWYLYYLVNLKFLAGLTPKKTSKVGRGEVVLQAVFALCKSNLKCKNNTFCSSSLGSEQQNLGIQGLSRIPLNSLGLGQLANPIPMSKSTKQFPRSGRSRVSGKRESSQPGLSSPRAQISFQSNHI